MRTIIGIFMALFGTLAAFLGFYVSYTSLDSLLYMENEFAGGIAVLTLMAGLNLALVGLIAVHLALGPKAKKADVS